MRRPLALVGLVTLIILIILGNADYKRGDGEKSFNRLIDDRVCVAGKVTNIEYKNENQVIYLKDAEFFSIKYPDEKLNSSFICYPSVSCDVASGSFVMLEGNLGEFKKATNEGEFDLKRYYYSIGYKWPVYDAVIISADKEGIFYEIINLVKTDIINRIDIIFNDEDAGIIKAMLLGSKSEIDKDIKSLYQKSGISHILAISGLHISLIGMFIYGMLNIFNINPNVRCGVTVIIMCIYGMMTGLGISTFRAVIMFILIMSSYMARRTYDLSTGLVIAAVVILLDNKYACLSGSFYLSFAAVIGVAIFSKYLTIDSERFEGKWVKAVNYVITSFAVSYFTFPVILYYYYEYPVYSVILNLIILPFMSMLLITSILAVVLSYISVNVSMLVAFPCHIILKLYESVCNVAVNMPFNHLVLGKPGIIRIVIYYAIIAAIMLITYKIRNMREQVISAYDNANKEMQNETVKVRIRKLYAVKMGLLILGFITMITPKPNMKISMLDIGQGDCISIITKEATFMIDGGSSTKKEIAKYIIEPYLKSQGVSRIDYWLVSHPDDDHISGLMEMLEGDFDIQIGCIVLPDNAKIREDAGRLIEAAKTKNVSISYAYASCKVEGDGYDITFINPDKNKEYDDANSYSEVFILTAGNFKMLFTGDATKDSEKMYIDYCEANGLELYDIDVYKVPHHGSNTSTSDRLISVIKPSYSLISSGKNNRYGHPKKEIIDKLNIIGTLIYNTQVHGEIWINVDKKGNYYISNFVMEEIGIYLSD